jgi:hypothetical protein
MTGAFTDTPDFAPYTVAPNQIPLTLGLTPAPSSAKAGSPSASALVPATPAQLGVPAAERAVYGEWVVWSRNGRFNGNGAIRDWANPAQLNRLDWYSAHGWKVPYPGDALILPPDQVPGANLPADYLGD